MISDSKYPLNLIKDVFDLHNDTSLKLTENAAEIVEKCIEKLDTDYFRYGYIIRRRYKDKEIIRVIAEEIDRSRAVVNSRIEKSLWNLSKDPDFRDAFTTDVQLEAPFDFCKADERLAMYQDALENGFLSLPKRYKRHY